MFYKKENQFFKIEVFESELISSFLRRRKCLCKKGSCPLLPPHLCPSVEESVHTRSQPCTTVTWYPIARDSKSSLNPTKACGKTHTVKKPPVRVSPPPMMLFYTGWILKSLWELEANSNKNSSHISAGDWTFKRGCQHLLHEKQVFQIQTAIQRGRISKHASLL